MIVIYQLNGECDIIRVSRKDLADLGFSLLELMVAMALISLLVTVAVPAYTQYQNRAKAYEYLVAVAPYKAIVEEWAQINPATASWPNQAQDLGFPTENYQGRYVQGVRYGVVSAGAIAYIAIEGVIDGTALVLVYQAERDTRGNVHWSCNTSRDHRSFFPSYCANDLASGVSG